MQVAKDLAIDLGADRPGALVKAAEAMGKNGINIDGFAVTGDGVLHLVARDPMAARRAVEGAGFKVHAQREVIIADVEDRPGTLAAVLRPAADAEVSVDLVYSLGSNRIAIGGKDFAKLSEALNVKSPAATRG